MTLTLPHEKVKKLRLKCQKLVSHPRMTLREVSRFSLLDSTGIATSYATNQVFTTTANCSCKRQFLLPVCNVSEPGFYSGTAMETCNGDSITWRSAMAN